MRSVLAFCPVPCIITSGFLSGEMAERLKAVDSKSTRGPKSPLVGSNPTLSAIACCRGAEKVAPFFVLYMSRNRGVSLLLDESPNHPGTDLSGKPRKSVAENPGIG